RAPTEYTRRPGHLARTASARGRMAVRCRPGPRVAPRFSRLIAPWYPACCPSLACAGRGAREGHTSQTGGATMVVRTLSIGAVVLAEAASAAGWTEQLLTGRMTVVSVDQAAGRFLCAEHGRWTATAGDDLKAVHAGDIVRVERAHGGLARVTVLRTAA